MVIKRYVFFILLLCIAIAPYFLVRLFWIASAESTEGKVAFIGKDISAQIPRSYSVVRFSSNGNDTLFVNSTDGEILEEGQIIPVFYQASNPKKASIGTFMSLWLDATVYGIVIFLIIAIVFFHPEIVPYKSQIQLQWKKPMISSLSSGHLAPLQGMDNDNAEPESSV